ncbi:MAG: hypothetical protein AAB557_05870 [Patescibacteria group bacterium]
MPLSEEERSHIGQEIQSEYVAALKEAQVYDIALKYLGSLGAIENCLHHPDEEEAKRLVGECIIIARKKSVSDDIIRTVLTLSLQAYQTGCDQGLYDLHTFDESELLGASHDSG